MIQYIAVFQSAIALTKQECYLTEKIISIFAFMFAVHASLELNSKVQFQTDLARLTLALQYSILCVTVNILKKRVHFKHIYAANFMSC